MIHGRNIGQSVTLAVKTLKLEFFYWLIDSVLLFRYSVSADEFTLHEGGRTSWLITETFAV